GHQGYLWINLVLKAPVLLSGTGSGRAEAGTMELSRILGDSVTFLLEIPAEQVRTVAWTVNATRSIVTVTAGTPPNVIVLDSSYEGRLRVPENNSLQITSLRMKDTGTYGAQITTASGISNRHFLLRMYKPTIVCDSVTCVKETCNYNLHCTVRDGGDNVTYSWTHTAGGAVVPNGSILHISLSPRDAHLNATCTAQNPVSNSSTTASAKGLCAGNSLCRTDSCLKQKQTCTSIGANGPLLPICQGLISQVTGRIRILTLIVLYPGLLAVLLPPQGDCPAAGAGSPERRDHRGARPPRQGAETRLRAEELPLRLPIPPGRSPARQPKDAPGGRSLAASNG
uniref:SLAM family member 5-like n=1 Tax=Gopherus evgoodei TaxID=1825980 RepID=A0A8C4VYW7_9SAUR